MSELKFEHFVRPRSKAVPDRIGRSVRLSHAEDRRLRALAVVHGCSASEALRLAIKALDKGLTPARRIVADDLDRWWSWREVIAFKRSRGLGGTALQERRAGG